MVFIGEYLKNTRIQKKITTNQVCKNLNISKYLVKQIEEDKFNKDFNNAYLTGHIRTYAKFLDLDDDEVVRKFKIQIQTETKNISNTIPKPIQTNHIFNFSKSISFISIIFISFGFYFFFIRTSEIQQNYSITPEISEDLNADLELMQMESDIQDLKKQNIKNDNYKDKKFVNLHNIDDLDIKKISQSSAIASLPLENEINEIINEDKITLKFLESTWIQIRDKNDAILVSRLMQSTDEFTYLSKENYKITTGNAGNIIVLINGKPKGKIGKQGDVIESFVINSNFNN